MNVYDAVRSRRSVRAFLGLPVPAAVLTRVLDAALRAPSGENLQPWRLYLLYHRTVAEVIEPTRAICGCTGQRGAAISDTGWRPAPSPAITWHGGSGYEVAFQANNGNLWNAGADGTGGDVFGMSLGTSPAITSV